jgi:cation diffusion facilitator family transporter
MNMIKLIKKWFIKDYEDTGRAEIRFRYGITAGVFGLVINAILTALKLTAGLIASSITIIADAVNSLSDAGSSTITLVGFKIAARPADKEHPYGHARFEYVAGLMVAFIVLTIGVLLGKSSVEKIIAPVPLFISPLTYAALGVSLALKIFQLVIYRNFGKSISSETLLASGTDSFNDILTTSAVLIATAVSAASGVNIDGYAGLAVSLFIVISSLRLIKRSVDPLLGMRPDRVFVDKVKKKLLSYDGILGFHDLIIHDYGEANSYITVHAEVAAEEDILKSHDLIDNIERDFMSELGVLLCIHIDPVEKQSPYVRELNEKIVAAMTTLIPAAAVHDFRVVVGATHTNVLFDVVVPYESKFGKAEVEAAARAAIDDGKTQFYFIIDIDRCYL